MRTALQVAELGPEPPRSSLAAVSPLVVLAWPMLSGAPTLPSKAASRPLSFSDWKTYPQGNRVTGGRTRDERGSVPGPAAVGRTASITRW